MTDGAKSAAIEHKLARIDEILARIEGLTEHLKADPDGHVRRSATELRAAFTARRALEPAIGRMRDSVQMLRRGNRVGTRREFERRATSLDHLDDVLEGQLLPHLRRLGFDV